MIGYSHKIAEEGFNTTQPKQQGWVQKFIFHIQPLLFVNLISEGNSYI